MISDRMDRQDRHFVPMSHSARTHTIGEYRICRSCRSTGPDVAPPGLRTQPYGSRPLPYAVVASDLIADLVDAWHERVAIYTADVISPAEAKQIAALEIRQGLAARLGLSTSPVYSVAPSISLPTGGNV